MKRLTAIVLAAAIILSYTSTIWAEEVQPLPEQTQPEQPGPSGGAVAAAVISDFFYIPGKLGTCVTSSILWTAGMALTGGMIYREAGDFVHDSCTGKWVLNGEEFMSAEDIPRL
jgi:hypothetical protein